MALKCIFLGLLCVSAFSQQIHNDTLFIYGEDIQKVELFGRENGARYIIDEVDFGYYVHPLTHSIKGNYTLAIYRDKKIFASNVVDTVSYHPGNLERVEKYFYIKKSKQYKTMGYTNKAGVVDKIEQSIVDDLTYSGRENKLYIYQIKNGVKSLVYNN